MNIVLTGYRGSGKTTVGKLLAVQLGWQFADTDKLVEQRSGRRIKQIFAEFGEAHFRELERQVVVQVCREQQNVISLGGGAVMDPCNQKEISRDSLVVYLEASAEALWQRINADRDTAETRPNLISGGLDEVVQLLRSRQATYCKFSSVIVDALQTPAAVAEQIQQLWQQQTQP